jgi:hypothetical protein
MKGAKPPSSSSDDVSAPKTFRARRQLIWEAMDEDGAASGIDAFVIRLVGGPAEQREETVSRLLRPLLG